MKVNLQTLNEVKTEIQRVKNEDGYAFRGPVRLSTSREDKTDAGHRFVAVISAIVSVTEEDDHPYEYIMTYKSAEWVHCDLQPDEPNPEKDFSEGFMPWLDEQVEVAPGVIDV